MIRFAANLSLLYTEFEFLERFAAAAGDGFRGVEVLFPYAVPVAEIAARLRDHGLEQVLINCPAGDFAAGERGTAILPGREAECLAGVERALEYARALGCARIHLLAGIAPPDVPRDRLRETFVGNLRTAARRAADSGVTVLIEPINPRDMPGYFLNTQADAARIVDETGAPNVGVQMDFYHCQIVEGDVTRRLREQLPRIRHVQIAGVPDRGEPDRGELDLRYVLGVLDALGYDGWVGCEYRPRAGTRAGLGWMNAFRSALAAADAVRPVGTRG